MKEVHFCAVELACVQQPPRTKLREILNKFSRPVGLAHATGVHERNTVPYARFALKKRHGFCAKAREKNMQRHRLGTL